MNRLAVALLLAAALTARADASTVVGSKHDLSTTGPGPIRALSEENPCIFCHVPHFSTGERLLHRPDPTAEYQPYASSTLQSQVRAPTGASRVCLSCHDGTIAVGKTLTRDIATTMETIPADRRSNLGVDLRSSHPISFAPAPGSRTHPPAPGDPVRLDGAGEVQCTSCHDPHREYNDPVQGKFLVKPNRWSGLCLTCHDSSAVSAADSSHAASPAYFGVAQGNEAQYTSVGEAGCAACHGSHSNDPGGRLVRKPPGDDDAACLRCHASGVTRVSLAADVAQPYAHHGQGAGEHDAAEGLTSGATRHVACVDCHDPHAASSRASPGAPAAAGALAGVWGIDAAGQRVEAVQYQYEVCLKCHGPTETGAPPLGAVQRAHDDRNLLRVFAPTSPSSHNVIAAARRPGLPGLLQPWASASHLYCTDCHASDAGPGNGGSGPRGPHGSSLPFLLEREYSTADGTPEAEASYRLCYKCHSRSVLLGDVPAANLDGTDFRKIVGATSVSLHRVHLAPLTGSPAPCSACHDAHGVSAEAGGTAQANAHLVDFDLAIAAPGPLGGPRYQTLGPRAGSCNLTCHGRPHTDESY